ncbi:hypothetical protein F4802DRAFT_584671 [Xylaria palmicola]|nr:hypothetical protein F4802DRAFT_584671 [Xylaria palmicola]
MASKVAEAISALREALPHSHLVVPEAAKEYQSLNNSCLSGLESDLYLAYIFLPESKNDVTAFIRAIRLFFGDVEFTIRAAGQLPLPCYANVQDGITVDLRNLKSLALKDDVV